MTDAADHPYRKQKQSGGTFAAFVWLVSGVYLFWVHPTASFLSWQSATYFIAGMFVAAIVFGVTFYLVEHGLSNCDFSRRQLDRQLASRVTLSTEDPRIELWSPSWRVSFFPKALALQIPSLSLGIQRSGFGRAARCPLSGVKRTSLSDVQMSAFDPKRTFPLLNHD